MKRRDFILLVGGFASVRPVAAKAQQPATPVIGFLGPTTEAIDGLRVAAFVERLRELGWTDGHNMKIEYRWADGRPERFDHRYMGHRDCDRGKARNVGHPDCFYDRFRSGWQWSRR